MTWECAAYGPNSGLGASECFMAGGITLFECSNGHHCHVRLRQERQRIWQVIQRLSASDEMWAEIARSIQHPEQLLGGSLSQPDDDFPR